MCALLPLFPPAISGPSSLFLFWIRLFKGNLKSQFYFSRQVVHPPFPSSFILLWSNFFVANFLDHCLRNMFVWHHSLICLWLDNLILVWLICSICICSLAGESWQRVTWPSSPWRHTPPRRASTTDTPSTSRYQHSVFCIYQRGAPAIFFGPLSVIPLFKNLSPLCAIPLVFQKFPVRYRYSASPLAEKLTCPLLQVR